MAGRHSSAQYDDDIYHPNSASGGGGNGNSSGSGGGGGPGGIDGDDPTFLLEHLATFTVSRENANGVVYPEDGMRRLLQLEKTTGIWSQKMEIALTKNRQVLIQDYDTKSVIEKFPVNWIDSPTPFTNNDPMELYNNILIFIVAPPPGIANHSYPEMHIFHCQNIDANILCNYLVNLKRGTDEVDYDRQQQQRSGSALMMAEGGGGHGHGQSKESHMQMQRHSEQRGSRNKYTRSESVMDDGNLPKSMFNSTLLSDKYERDVQVLNYCFDDIEKFIARLQHSAAASRELERRRRSKKYKNGGYQDPGEGLLSLRTRPPTESEFCDVFAKFKLSFNLLAKLKSHIHDPNAPELVHFLFTPLALIVDASHDIIPMSHGSDGSPKSYNLPSQVVAPLLTTEAINLLVNCVTSKETELWRSLGEAWQLPRSKFCIKYNHVGDVNFHPQFYDGWSPDFPLNFDESSDDTTPHTPPANLMMGGGPSASAAAGRRMSKESSKEPSYMHHPQYQQQQQLQQQLHKELEDSISIDSIEHRGHGMLLTHPLDRDMGHHHQQQQQHHHRQSTSARESNERATGSASNNNGGGGAGGAGHEERDVNAWIHELQSRRAKIVHVTYPRTANNEKEMTVHRGEVLEVLDDTRKWWKARSISGEVGHVPHTIVSPLPGNGNDKMGNGSSGNGGGGGGGGGSSGQDVFQNPLYSKDYQK